MKHIEEQFNTAKTLSLTSEERERMLSFLKSYREIHPVRDESLLRREEGLSGFFSMFARVASPVALMVFIFGTGVVTAAQNALPGQFLYPVKTSTEEVRSALMVSDEAVARFDAERATRRLEEARSLAVRGEASEGVVKSLEEEFVNHMNDLERHLEGIKQDRAEAVLEIEAEFDSAVRIYSQVLAALSGEGAPVGGLSNTLALRSNGFGANPEGVAIMSLPEAASVPEAGTFALDAPESPGREGEEALDGAEALEETADIEDELAMDSEMDSGSPRMMAVEPMADSGFAPGATSEIGEANLNAMENIARKKLGLLESGLEKADAEAWIEEELTRRYEGAEASFDEGVRVKNEGRNIDALVHFRSSLTTSQDALTVLTLLKTVTNPRAIESLLGTMLDTPPESESVPAEPVREEPGEPSLEGSDGEEGEEGAGLDDVVEDLPEDSPEVLEEGSESIETDIDTSLPL